MTILVAVRTGSAVVLAADSKLSTGMIVGRNPDGSPRWVPQTYDHAVKITQDASGTAIAAFAGNGNIGEQSAVDYFARQKLLLHDTPAEQDKKLNALASRMQEERRRTAEKHGTTLDQVSPTIMLLAAPPLEGVAPRAWRVALEGASHRVEETLQVAFTWLEGSKQMAEALLYGLEEQRGTALGERLGVEPKKFNQAVVETLDLVAIRRINFWTMPIQDAIDFAVFIAQVQVEMDRFLPGFGNCGGPIDVMTLEMSPSPRIRSFPGKTLAHPHAIKST